MSSSTVRLSESSSYMLSRRTLAVNIRLCRMKMQSKASPMNVDNMIKQGGSQRISIKNNNINFRNLEISRRSLDDNVDFSRPQQSEELSDQEMTCFEDFMVGEATLDEEYWTAAWLRAESQWENRLNERYAGSYKRKYAEQEFIALKGRGKGYLGQTTSCIVTVKKEDKAVKHYVTKSVVGTLDISINYFLQGETFPGERIEAPVFCNRDKSKSRYGYVSNLCVAKSSRRKGIAINMLKFAIESAKSKGAEQVFVHVHRDNKAAQLLYEKLGFEIVDSVSRRLEEEKLYLLCVQT